MEGPKTVTMKKTLPLPQACFCCPMPLIPVPSFSQMEHFTFILFYQEMSCLFVSLVCFGLLLKVKKGEEKEEKTGCVGQTWPENEDFRLRNNSLLKHFKAVFSSSHGRQGWVFFCVYCVTVYPAFFLERLKGQKNPYPSQAEKVTVHIALKSWLQDWE